MIPKGEDKHRKIEDGSNCYNRWCARDFAPNSFVNKDHLPVRFASTNDAIDAIHEHPGCIMKTWDLEAAYHHLVINFMHWGCTGFNFDGDYYFSPRLNFGSRASPSRFNLYSEAAAQMIMILFGAAGKLLPPGGAHVLVC